MGASYKKENKPLSALTPAYIRSHIKAITFDVDGVTIPTGTIIQESKDNTRLWIHTHRLSAHMSDCINRLKKHVWVNFSSGRSLLFMQYLLGDVLWNRVSLTAENGNFVFKDGSITQIARYPKRYFQLLNDIRTDLYALDKKNPRLIHGFEPKHLILTAHTSHPISAIERLVKKHDTRKELYCLWGSEAYDIGHKRTNKTTALKFLCKELRITPQQMITTGNNVNDREMLDFGVGVSVNPRLVSAPYAITSNRTDVPGKILAQYVLDAFERKT